MGKLQKRTSSRTRRYSTRHWTLPYPLKNILNKLMTASSIQMMTISYKQQLRSLTMTKNQYYLPACIQNPARCGARRSHLIKHGLSSRSSLKRSIMISENCNELTQPNQSFTGPTRKSQYQTRSPRHWTTWKLPQLRKICTHPDHLNHQTSGRNQKKFNGENQ